MVTDFEDRRIDSEGDEFYESCKTKFHYKPD